MDPCLAYATWPLVATNLLLAVICGGSTVAVAIALMLDLRERRRRRALVPPCWPPPGVDPQAAYAPDMVCAATGARR